MTTIGLVGAGAMGSALGAGWLAGGAQVLTCLAGRSDRTRALVDGAGIAAVDDLDELVGISDWWCQSCHRDKRSRPPASSPPLPPGPRRTR